MVSLEEIVNFCQQRADVAGFKDFPEARNGLQLANQGTVTKIGAAVDAGLVPFEQAADAGVDFLIVHHGLFWAGAKRIVGPEYRKYKTALDANLAVYACHLPLDAHPEIGNSALLARQLGAELVGTFLPYEGRDIGQIAAWSDRRASLRERLEALFPNGITSIEFGSDAPRKVCIVTGSGSGAVSNVRGAGADTLITGELKQHDYNLAQELGLNLYACGHYATETFGVDALARECAARFSLPYAFIPTDCPL